jgi:hypothetical protein
MKNALIIGLCVLVTLALLLMGIGLGAVAGMSLCCDLLDECRSAEPSICLVGLPLGALVGLSAAIGGSLALWFYVARVRSRRRSSAAAVATEVSDADEGAQHAKGSAA